MPSVPRPVVTSSCYLCLLLVACCLFRPTSHACTTAQMVLHEVGCYGCLLYVTCSSRSRNSLKCRQPFGGGGHWDVYSGVYLFSTSRHLVFFPNPVFETVPAPLWWSVLGPSYYLLNLYLNDHNRPLVVLCFSYAIDRRCHKMLDRTPWLVSYRVLLVGCLDWLNFIDGNSDRKK